MRKITIVLFFLICSSISAATFQNPVQVLSPFAEKGYAYPEFADFDGDGAKDLMMGFWNLPVAFYENSGNNTAPVFSTGSVVYSSQGDSIKSSSY